MVKHAIPRCPETISAEAPERVWPLELQVDGTEDREHAREVSTAGDEPVPG